MPSVSEKQRRFFGLVHAVQKGKVSPKSVSKSVRKAAHSTTQKQSSEFARSVKKDSNFTESMTVKKPFPMIGQTDFGKLKAELIHKTLDEIAHSVNKIRKDL